MTIFYIILGILVGVPAYLLLNTILGLIVRPFIALCVLLWDLADSSFMNEIKGGPGSLAETFRTEIKVVGWAVLAVFLVAFVVSVIGRLFWLVYRGFRAWLKLVKFCWNLCAAKKKIRIRKR